MIYISSLQHCILFEFSFIINFIGFVQVLSYVKRLCLQFRCVAANFQSMYSLCINKSNDRSKTSYSILCTNNFTLSLRPFEDRWGKTVSYYASGTCAAPENPANGTFPLLLLLLLYRLFGSFVVGRFCE